MFQEDVPVAPGLGENQLSVGAGLVNQSQDAVKPRTIGLWEKEGAQLEGIDRGRLPGFDETCQCQ